MAKYKLKLKVLHFESEININNITNTDQVKYKIGITNGKNILEKGNLKCLLTYYGPTTNDEIFLDFEKNYSKIIDMCFKYSLLSGSDEDFDSNLFFVSELNKFFRGFNYNPMRFLIRKVSLISEDLETAVAFRRRFKKTLSNRLINENDAIIEELNNKLKLATSIKHDFMTSYTYEVGGEI